MEWKIPVSSFCVRKKLDNSNPAEIIEFYRKLQREKKSLDADNYLSEKKNTIEDYIKRCSNPNQVKPDYIQTFGTQDKVRNEIIETFKRKMIGSSFSNESLPDYSKHFTKKNKSVSIRDMVGTIDQKATNFDYKRPDGINSIKALWIIDDTIDTGSTIEIFLNNLFINGLLNDETTISVFILYNLQKKDSVFKKGWLDKLDELK